MLLAVPFPLMANKRVRCWIYEHISDGTNDSTTSMKGCVFINKSHNTNSKEREGERRERGSIDT